MVSVNQRGWTWLSEDEAPDPDSSRGIAVSARATALMNEWSILHHEMEQEGFRRQSDAEDGRYDDFDPRICECDEGASDDPDELCVHDRRALNDSEEAEKVKSEGQRLKLELIEAELAGLGARKMRPYEHWNEQEREMEWLEAGRFGHYYD